MLDWLTWPADLLLSAGGAVASLFVSPDEPSFLLIQMMVATLVLAAIASMIVWSQSLVDYLRSLWKTPQTKRFPYP
jgi:hypothetical protein